MGSHETASLITDNDLYLFNEGSHFQLYDKLGAHVVDHEGCQRHSIRCLGAQCRAGFCHGRFQRLE